MMGIVIVLFILAAYFVGRIYVEPLFVVLIIFIATVILFILSYIIVRSFERMAFVSREKSEFISIMSHQLRTPLSAIKWQLDLLLRSSASLTSEKAREAILAAEEQNNRMIKLANDMLEVNRLENNECVFEKETVSLNSLVKEAVDKNKKQASLLGSKIVFSESEKDIKVRADKNRLETVVSHLLDNSIKYGDGGRINIFLEAIGNKARFSISDEGVGIPKEDFNNIFKKFFRGSISRKYKSDGLGIGLYIAKSIIDSFGGEISFSSIEGKGTTFWFTIPISKK